MSTLLSRLELYGAAGNCPWVGVPYEDTCLIMPRKLLRAALSAPTIEHAAVRDGMLLIEGQRARYKLRLWPRPEQNGAGTVSQEIIKWAASKRRPKAVKPKESFHCVEAKWWAIDKGYRGVADAQKRLERDAIFAANRYRDVIARKAYIYKKQEPPSDQEWLKARIKRQKAGHWLARQSRQFEWTSLRGELGAILGCSLPPWSGLTIHEKERASREVAIGYIRQATVGGGRLARLPIGQMVRGPRIVAQPIESGRQQGVNC